MRLTALFITASLAAASARADIVAHSLVSYGDLTFVTSEQYGSPSAHASLSYASPGIFTGESSSFGAYGLVGGSVEVSSINASYPTNRALAEAAFHDTLTISGPTGAGFIQYEYTVDGHGHEAHGHLFLDHQGDPSEELAHLHEAGVFTSELHNIIFGTPFQHGLAIEIAASVALGESEEAHGEFTAYMSAIHLFDATMTPISTFSINSESGTTYPLAPAPSSLTLLAAGRLILHQRRR